MLNNHPVLQRYTPFTDKGFPNYGGFGSPSMFPPPPYTSSMGNDGFDFSKVVGDATDDDEDDDVKRPMNSFLLWAKIMRRKYATENPNLHNAEVSKLLGKIWNSMTIDEKRPYVERAEKLRVIHMRTYPNYRYAPKKRKDKKGQRMVAPEIAAALHSTLFDLSSGINGQHVGPDLKSFGYLRSLYEAKLSSAQILAMINPPGSPFSFVKNANNVHSTFQNSDQRLDALSYQDNQSSIINASAGTPSVASTSSDVDADTNARTTLHYHPANYEDSCKNTSCMMDSHEFQSDGSDTEYVSSSSPELDLIPCDSLDLFQSDYDDSSYGDLACSPQMTIEPIEDNIPDILKECESSRANYMDGK